MDFKRNLHSVRRDSEDIGRNALLQLAKKETFWREAIENEKNHARMQRQQSQAENDELRRQTLIVLENYKARLMDTTKALQDADSTISQYIEESELRNKKVYEILNEINRCNPYLQNNVDFPQKILSSGKRSHHFYDDEVIMSVEVVSQLRSILDLKSTQLTPPKSTLHVTERDDFTDILFDGGAKSDQYFEKNVIIQLYNLYGTIHSRIMEGVDLTDEQTKLIDDIFVDLGLKAMPSLNSPEMKSETKGNNNGATSALNSNVKLIIQGIESKIGSKTKGKKMNGTLCDLSANILPSPAQQQAAGINKPFSYQEGTAQRKKQRKVTPHQLSNDKENSYPLFFDRSAPHLAHPASTPPSTPLVFSPAANSPAVETTAIPPAQPDSKKKTPSKLKTPKTITAKKAKEVLIPIDDVDEQRSKILKLTLELEEKAEEVKSLQSKLRNYETEMDSLRREALFLQLENDHLWQRCTKSESAREYSESMHANQKKALLKIRRELLSAKREIVVSDAHRKDVEAAFKNSMGHLDHSDSAFGCMDDIYKVEENFENYFIPCDRLRISNNYERNNSSYELVHLEATENNQLVSVNQDEEREIEATPRCCSTCFENNKFLSVILELSEQKNVVTNQLLEALDIAELQRVAMTNLQNAIDTMVTASQNNNVCEDCALSSVRINDLESENERLTEQILEVLQIAEAQAIAIHSQNFDTPSGAKGTETLDFHKDENEDEVQIMLADSESDSSLFASFVECSMDRSEFGEVKVQPESILDLSDVRSEVFDYSSSTIFSTTDKLEKMLVLKKVLGLIGEPHQRDKLLPNNCSGYTPDDVIPSINSIIIKYDLTGEEATILRRVIKQSTEKNRSPQEFMEFLFSIRNSLASLKSDLYSAIESVIPVSIASNTISHQEDEFDVYKLSDVIVEMRNMVHDLKERTLSLQKGLVAVHQEKTMLHTKIGLMAASRVWERDELLFVAQKVSESREEIMAASNMQQHQLELSNERINTLEEEVLELKSRNKLIAEPLLLELEDLRAKHFNIALNYNSQKKFIDELQLSQERAAKELLSYNSRLQAELCLAKDELLSATEASSLLIGNLNAEKKNLRDRMSRMASSLQEERAHFLQRIVNVGEEAAARQKTLLEELQMTRDAYNALATDVLNKQIAILVQDIETNHASTSVEICNLRLEVKQLRDLLDNTKATSTHTIEILKREIAQWREQINSSSVESNKIITILREESRKLKSQKEALAKESSTIIANLQKELTELMTSISQLKEESEAEMTALREERTRHENHKTVMMTSLEEEKLRIKQQMEDDQRLFIISVELLQEELHLINLANEHDDHLELKRRFSDLQDDVRRWRQKMGKVDDASVFRSMEMLKSLNGELAECKRSLADCLDQLQTAKLASAQLESTYRAQLVSKDEQLSMQQVDFENIREKLAIVSANKSEEIKELTNQLKASQQELVFQKQQERERATATSNEFTQKMNALKDLTREKLSAAIEEQTQLMREAFKSQLEEFSDCKARVAQLEQELQSTKEEFFMYRKRAEEISEECEETIARQMRENEQLRTHQSITQREEQLQREIDRLKGREDELKMQILQLREQSKVTSKRPLHSLQKLKADIDSRPALPGTEFIVKERKLPVSAIATAALNETDSSEEKFSASNSFCEEVSVEESSREWERKK